MVKTMCGTMSRARGQDLMGPNVPFSLGFHFQKRAMCVPFPAPPMFTICTSAFYPGLLRKGLSS